MEQKKKKINNNIKKYLETSGLLSVSLSVLLFFVLQFKSLPFFL